jgi:HAD superfamily hydrolase (TIGR01662 family)
MEVLLVCGPPASGKSTVTKELSLKGYSVLNRDSEGGSIAQLLPKLEFLLNDNKNVILDNLFPTIESRKPFIDLVKNKGSEIRCIVMSTSIEDATFNFVQRAIGILGEFPTPELIKKSKHPNIFPPAVLFKYRKEFEKPTVTEGFKSIETFNFVRKDDPSFTNKALILDYDSTLRECIGGNGKYPISKDQIKIMPNRTEVLKKYKADGYLLLGMSNQSGIHKRELSNEMAHELFQYTNKLLVVDIEYNFCPHQSAPISCYCRKPQTGKAIEMIIKHKLNRHDCIFVGDYTTDATWASRAGFKYFDQKDFFK